MGNFEEQKKNIEKFFDWTDAIKRIQDKIDYTEKEIKQNIENFFSYQNASKDKEIFLWIMEKVKEIEKTLKTEKEIHDYIKSKSGEAVSEHNEEKRVRWMRLYEQLFNKDYTP